jgi:hypothetical protein
MWSVISLGRKLWKNLSYSNSKNNNNNSNNNNIIEVYFRLKKDIRSMPKLKIILFINMLDMMICFGVRFLTELLYLLLRDLPGLKQE